MTVRCVVNDPAALPDARVRDRLSDVIHLHGPIDGLTIGDTYLVMAVEARRDGMWLYLHTFDSSPYPFPYPAELFEIEDPSVPANWSMSLGQRGRNTTFGRLSFPAWALDEGFYERLLDGDVDATSTYNRERVSLIPPPQCPVCGFELEVTPWDHDRPSDEICPCCGIHFGYDDAVGGVAFRRTQCYADWRERWIAGGSSWWSNSRTPPSGWDAKQQLGKVNGGDRSRDFLRRARHAITQVFGNDVVVLAEDQAPFAFGNASIVFRVGGVRIEVRRERGELLYEVQMPTDAAPGAFMSSKGSHGSDSDENLLAAMQWFVAMVRK